MCPGNRGTRHEDPDGRVSVSARLFFGLFCLSFLFSPVACLASWRVLVIKRLMSLSSMPRPAGTYLSSTSTSRFVLVSIDLYSTDVVGGVHGKGGSGNSQQAMGWPKSQNASRYLDIRIEGGEIPRSETVP